MLLRDLLLEHFGADRAEILDPALAGRPGRIGKVSPAFIKELCRRAAQEMLERGAGTLQDRDFERSLQDLRLRPKGLSPVREKVGFTG